MKKVLLSTLLVLVLVSSVFSAGYAADGKVADSQRSKDLAAARRATAKYHDVDVAIADGYLPTQVCVSGPGGAAMGYHYVNPTLAMDPAISLTAPEVLLYAPDDEGGVRLVGVEYFFAIGRPDELVPSNPPPAPVLFGRPFDGPMLGHEPGMPPITTSTYGSGRQTRMAHLPRSTRTLPARNKNILDTTGSQLSSR